MSKYLYVDSEGRVCRIDAETGAMVPIEWNQPDVDAARKRYEMHVYRLWANGRTEGFGEDAIIKNRIPVALHEARNESRGTPLSDIATKL